MELRDPETADVDRVRELVESTMTTAYALSPRQIDAFLEEEFGEDRLAEAFEDSETVTLVADSTVDGGETTTAGIVTAEPRDDAGEVRWLFVDPEHRGAGIGTRLFETAVERLRERGLEPVRASVLEANREGGQFFEGFGFERIDDRTAEVAGESLVENVYGEPSADAEPAVESETRGEPEDLPNTETDEGVTTATTDDGEQVYLNREESGSGTEAPFFVAYTDEEHTEQFGYYCANCGSLDAAMDDMGRVECGECNNTHAERSEEAYDDAHL